MGVSVVGSPRYNRGAGSHCSPRPSRSVVGDTLPEAEGRGGVMNLPRGPEHEQSLGFTRLPPHLGWEVSRVGLLAPDQRPRPALAAEGHLVSGRAANGTTPCPAGPRGAEH